MAIGSWRASTSCSRNSRLTRANLAEVTIDAFLKTAWNDHADRPQEVAERIAASSHLVETPEQLAAFARLLTHVYGEHLGQWTRGVELLDSLRCHPSAAVEPAAVRTIDVGAGALRYCDGDASALVALTRHEQVSALANASSALAARNEFARAIAGYDQALQLAQKAPPPEGPAMRVLAAAGNNLAVLLEAKVDRSASETQAMLAAGGAALRHWKQVGTWLEEERAEHRLARSRLQAGEPTAAMQSAERCVAVCERNGAPPFERFFAHSVLACAHRASGDAVMFAAHRQVALRYLEQTSEDERKWCESEREDLES
jgi:hypothetical protein